MSSLRGKKIEQKDVLKTMDCQTQKKSQESSENDEVTFISIVPAKKPLGKIPFSTNFKNFR